MANRETTENDNYESEDNYGESPKPNYGAEDIRVNTCIISQSETPSFGFSEGMSQLYLVNTIPEIIMIINHLPKEVRRNSTDDLDEDEDDHLDQLVQETITRLETINDFEDGAIKESMIPQLKLIIKDFNKAFLVGIVDTDCISDSQFELTGTLKEYLWIRKIQGTY